MAWEIEFLNHIQNLIHSDLLDKIMPNISALGNAGIIWIIISLILLLIPKYRKIGIASAISLILMLVCGNMIIKPLVGRLRPFTLNTSFQLLIPPPSDFSFPSGHTFASFASATAIFSYNRKLGIPALVLASLIAFSRLYLYVHFPTDVLAGLLLGIAAGRIGWYLSVRLGKKTPA